MAGGWPVGSRWVAGGWPVGGWWVAGGSVMVRHLDPVVPGGEGAPWPVCGWLQASSLLSGPAAGAARAHLGPGEPALEAGWLA